MGRFSGFILAPGTAGPAIREGIRALGFALQTDFPAILASYLRLDQAQTFNDPQKLQGRTNLGLGTISTQNANAVALTGGSITGITDLAIADGGTGASTAPAARTALGLGNVDNTSDAAKPVSTAQQTALNLKAPLASPALTGNPTAPTQAPGNNSTRLATTAYVDAAVAPISNSTFAWANFDGVTGIIRGSKNVSSITKNGTGDFTINFIAPLPDTNCATIATGSWNSGVTALSIGAAYEGVASVNNRRVQFADTGGSLRDPLIGNVEILR